MKKAISILAIVGLFAGKVPGEERQALVHKLPSGQARSNVTMTENGDSSASITVNQVVVRKVSDDSVTAVLNESGLDFGGTGAVLIWRDGDDLKLKDVGSGQTFTLSGLAAVADGKVDKAGDTMTGALTIQQAGNANFAVLKSTNTLSPNLRFQNTVTGSGATDGAVIGTLGAALTLAPHTGGSVLALGNFGAAANLSVAGIINIGNTMDVAIQEVGDEMLFEDTVANGGDTITLSELKHPQEIDFEQAGDTYLRRNEGVLEAQDSAGGPYSLAQLYGGDGQFVKTDGSDGMQGISGANDAELGVDVINTTNSSESSAGHRWTAGSIMSGGVKGEAMAYPSNYTNIPEFAGKFVVRNHAGPLVLLSSSGGAIDFYADGYSATDKKLQVTSRGIRFVSGATQTISAAGNTITPNSSRIVLDPSSNITLTSTPHVTAGHVAGDIFVFTVPAGEANTVTLQDAGTLPGSGMELGAANRTLGDKDKLVLMSNGTSLEEISYANN